MLRLRWWILGSLLAGLSYPLIEGRWVETTHTSIPLPGLTRPVRVLHLSDLHLGEHPNQQRLEQLAQEAVASRPDLICLTGDYVDGHFTLQNQQLHRMVQTLARAAPVYAVMGNHDGGAWAARWGDRTPDPVRLHLEKGGAQVLHNRWQVVEVRGQKLLLVGLGDLWSHDADPDTAFPAVPPRLPTLVLAHNPDTKDLIANRPWHLMLAGHTHGNQVNLPFYEERWATVRDARFIAGHYEWHGRQLYINRGLGGAWGLRFRSRPEISILELVPRV